MEHVWEDLRISVVDRFEGIVAALQSPQVDDDDETCEIGRKVRETKSQLQLLKRQGKEYRNQRREEYKQLSYELYEQQRNLHRLGKKAQRHVSLYEYAALMRNVGYSNHYTTTTTHADTETTERLIGKRPDGLEAPSTTTSHNNNSSAQPPNIGTTLILRSQTFYGSSAYLWQLMVQSVLEVRLLKKCHLLTMLKAQQSIFKAHRTEEVQRLALYATSTEQMDEVCLDMMQRKALIWKQIEDTQLLLGQSKETLEEVVGKQRRLILKLKLRQGQAHSGRVKENIEKRRSSLGHTIEKEKRQSTLKQEIDNSPVPFLAELKRESLKRLSTIAERLSQDMNGPLVDAVRMEFSVDQSLLEEEEEEEVQAAKRSVANYGRTSPQSQDTSGGLDSSSSANQRGAPAFGSSSNVAFGSNVSLGSAMLEPQAPQPEDHASYRSNSTLSDDSLELNPEMVSPATNAKKKKRSRTELKHSLNRLASLNSSQRSIASGDASIKSGVSRSELEHRRLQAEQRLAKSKRASKRMSMQAQRDKAKQRLEESKKRLQGFLSTASDDSDLDNDDSESISFSGHDDDGDGDENGVIHPFSSFQEGESSTSLRSPDAVANFPDASSKTSVPLGTGKGN